MKTEGGGNDFGIKHGQSFLKVSCSAKMSVNLGLKIGKHVFTHSLAIYANEVLAFLGH